LPFLRGINSGRADVPIVSAQYSPQFGIYPPLLFLPLFDFPSLLTIVLVRLGKVTIASGAV
jgi:hypothetical protein